VPVAVSFLNRSILPLDDQFNSVLASNIPTDADRLFLRREYMASTFGALALHGPPIVSR
jgi:hypothetical protein